MSIKQYPGGIITKNPTAPTTSSAKGIWTLDQAQNYTKQGIWPRSPGAPTIGTATAVGTTAATVTYTAPSDLGTGSVTYTATSSPGGLTGTGASPITVTGLTINTTYTFTVTATTPGGTGPASAASNSVTPALPAIGSAYGGGFFAGQINVSGTVYNLVVADKTVGQTVNSNGSYGTDDPGAVSVIDGPTNSAYLAARGGAYPAAQFCENLNTGGYTDWYLPAKNELEVLYYFLKPTTTSNNTSSGSNANAVSPEPISTNYSTGAPSQTTAAAFQTGGAQALTDTDPNFLTSTQNNIYAWWVQTFTNGAQTTISKNASATVRAIRRVAA